MRCLIPLVVAVALVACGGEDSCDEITNRADTNCDGLIRPHIDDGHVCGDCEAACSVNDRHELLLSCFLDGERLQTVTNETGELIGYRCDDGLPERFVCVDGVTHCATSAGEVTAAARCVTLTDYGAN